MINDPGGGSRTGGLGMGFGVKRKKGSPMDKCLRDPELSEFVVCVCANSSCSFNSSSPKDGCAPLVFFPAHLADVAFFFGTFFLRPCQKISAKHKKGFKKTWKNGFEGCLGRFFCASLQQF